MLMLTYYTPSPFCMNCSLHNRVGLGWTGLIKWSRTGGTTARDTEVGVEATVQCRVYGVLSLGRGAEHEGDVATERQRSVRRR